MRKICLCFGTVLLSVVTSPAVAQDNVREACMADLRKYCSSELMTFDREKVRACLRTNIKKTSPACRAAVKARREAEAAKKPG